MKVTSVEQILQEFVARRRLAHEAAFLVRRLEVVRNIATHEADKITTAAAVEYQLLARNVAHDLWVAKTRLLGNRGEDWQQQAEQGPASTTE